ncbi:hypothetical protein F5Y16DRAFT_399696 [Xylariaceae sp. FL0255]|nr:hypothetical protein F5Y16DRAFT_399696 [Xylariaceae sp. FL0255]
MASGLHPPVHTPRAGKLSEHRVGRRSEEWKEILKSAPYDNASVEEAQAWMTKVVARHKHHAPEKVSNLARWNGRDLHSHGKLLAMVAVDIEDATKKARKRQKKELRRARRKERKEDRIAAKECRDRLKTRQKQEKLVQAADRAAASRQVDGPILTDSDSTMPVDGENQLNIAQTMNNNEPGPSCAPALPPLTNSSMPGDSTATESFFAPCPSVPPMSKTEKLKNKIPFKKDKNEKRVTFGRSSSSSVRPSPAPKSLTVIDPEDFIIDEPSEFWSTRPNPLRLRA